MGAADRNTQKFFTPSSPARLSEPAERAAHQLPRMNWSDYEFIREEPPDLEKQAPIVLTGWETIIFEIADEEDVSTS